MEEVLKIYSTYILARLGEFFQPCTTLNKLFKQYQSPANFGIELYAPNSLLAWGTDVAADDAMIKTLKEVHHTRLKYARISVVALTESMPSLPDDVRFRIILEPLEFGILPSSVIPIIFALLLVVCTAAVAVPRLNRYFARLADKAKEELATDEKKK